MEILLKKNWWSLQSLFYIYLFITLLFSKIIVYVVEDFPNAE